MNNNQYDDKPPEEQPIDATPLAKDLWAGIAGHFDSFTQVVCEFVDNSISNFEARKGQPRSIHIQIEEEPETVRILIEDTGTGIEQFAPAMRIGDQSVRQTPLNEHGFGLKHALASANPDNDSWLIRTRTKAEFQNGSSRQITAPYSFGMKPEKLTAAGNPWPGIFNGSGTIIEFRCSQSLFNTVQRGIKGQAGFIRCLDYLAEELGYIYSGIIEKGKASISVASSTGNYNRTIAATKPSWVDFYPPGSGSDRVDLGNGEVLVQFEFGEMRESENYIKHYKRNQSTSGAEIRINGRLMMANVFKDIWQLENHPSYNHFLAVINLVSDNRDTLPKTRTSKNGIRSGDPKLEALFSWIRKTHPNPHKDLANALTERELIRELRELKERHIPAPSKHIEQEFKVFNSLNSPVSVDLYVFDGRNVVLYEAKKDVADVQNAYQLLMYWDGAVEDGKIPAEGILIASSFSPGVDAVISVFNRTKDRQGNIYKFSTKTWTDEGILYPK